MKQLININTKDMIIVYQTDSKLFKLKDYYDKSFIHHCLALFATLKLVRKDDKVSMSATLAAIPEIHITTEGEFSRSTINDLIYITSTFARSKLVEQTKFPHHGALTPLFMYAHKAYNDVKYSEWDRNDKYIRTALGTFLAAAYDHTIEMPFPPTFADPASMRSVLMKDKKPTAYNLYLKYREVDEESNEEYHYGKEILTLTLQTWLANVEKRVESAMLLDIYEFGSVPPALDAKIVKGSYSFS